MPMPYTSAALAAALCASERRWSFRYERVSGGIVIGEEWTQKCTVKHNDLADIKRTCDVVLDAGTEFDQLVDQLRPYARLLMPDGSWQEWLLGTFYLQSSKQRRAAAAGDNARAFVGYDGTKLLIDDKMLDRYVVTAGTAVTDQVRDMLDEVGLPMTGVAGSAATLSAAMEWEPGTSRLKVMNDLLTSINYRPIRFNALGAPVATPYVPPDEAPVLWRYEVSASSVTRPGVDYELDLFDVPNRWVGFVSVPDTAPLRSVVINNDPGDPLSTVGRGRNITRVIETQELGQAPTQALLDALVSRVAQEDRSQYETATFSTGLMPIHDSGDVCELTFSGTVERYRETEWTMELTAGGAMTHSMRRVVQL